MTSKQPKTYQTPTKFSTGHSQKKPKTNSSSGPDINKKSANVYRPTPFVMPPCEPLDQRVTSSSMINDHEERRSWYRSPLQKNTLAEKCDWSQLAEQQPGSFRLRTTKSTHTSTQTSNKATPVGHSGFPEKQTSGQKNRFCWNSQ